MGQKNQLNSKRKPAGFLPSLADMFFLVLSMNSFFYAFFFFFISIKMYLDLIWLRYLYRKQQTFGKCKKVLLFLHIFNALDETDGNGPDGC